MGIFDLIEYVISTVADILVLGIGARTIRTEDQYHGSYKQTRHGIYVIDDYGSVVWLVPDHYVAFGRIRTGIAAMLIASLASIVTFMFMCLGAIILPFIIGSTIFFSYYKLNKPVPLSTWKERIRE